MMRAAAFLLLWICSTAARAQDPARLAEQAGDPAAEHDACSQIVAATPDTSAGVRCARRLAWLADRRDPDGGFRSLTDLLALRRELRTLPPEEARARVSSVAGDPAASEQVRLEAGLWLVREAQDRGDTASALAWSGVLWEAYQRGAGTDPTRREIADLRAQALARDGQAAAALAVEAATDPLRSARPREGLPLLLLEARRARRLRLAGGLAGLYALLALPLSIRGWRRLPRPLPRPLGLLVLAVICGAFAAISAPRAPESLPVFAGLLGGLLALHLLSAGALHSTRRPALRAALRLGAALASAAAGYLALHASGQLDSVGL